ncbi:hypothetical protein CYJ29_05805 [Aerococcus loyolae]|nr:hypothetical protein HMPREF2784_04345 [Aerococcus loyolae]PKY85649.1 hypothetical protein CYJ30_05520 [Aerococcus loyolae]PKZ03517.1 hypothetical protein CYJ29_05805 [Aerococcus loyolae]
MKPDGRFDIPFIYYDEIKLLYFEKDELILEAIFYYSPLTPTPRTGPIPCLPPGQVSLSVCPGQRLQPGDGA